MKSQMWVVRMVPVASAIVMAAAPVAFAQYGVYGNGPGSGSGSELFEWNGRVDREVQVVMRGNRVWTNDIGRTEPGRERSRVMDNLPRRDGQVSIEVINGRGQVDVIQQPTQQNNYTTIVRIQDPRSGSDTYRLAAYWQAYSNGDVYGRNNGRARGRDDIYRGRDRGNGNSQGNYPSNGTYYPGGVNGNNTMMRWTGNVDDDMEIRIQNGRLIYRTLSGKDPTSIRADESNMNIPNGARGVSVVQNQGRGTVVVTQQPSSWNGYTTVIRIRDPQGGYGFYDFSLMWQ